MKEEWRDIGIIDGIDYTGLYQCSNTGKFKTMEKTDSIGRIRHEKILNGFLNDGYIYVALFKNKIKKEIGLHRLVALTFGLEPTEQFKNVPLDELDINHKDENKQNNCILNLEWCDKGYNNEYGKHYSRVSEKLKGRKRGYGMKKQAIVQINKETNEVINVFSSLRQASKSSGISHNTLSFYCKGIWKQNGEYIWKYAV